MIESARPKGPHAMSAAECDALLALGTGASNPYERDASIAACFAKRVSETPHAAAVVDAAGSLSYLELDRASNALARYLATSGVLHEHTVGIMIDRSRLLPVALLGILKAGAAYVPLDSSYGRERLDHMRTDAGFTCVIVAGNIPTALRGDGIKIIDLLRDANAIEFSDDDALSDLGMATSLAYVMYTSGSTGRPKGVAIEQRAIVRLVRGTDYITISADDVFLQFAPPTFDASTFEIWAPLLNGATLAITRPGPMSLDELGREIAFFGITTLWLTAPLFRMIVETELPAFTGLRNLLTGGDIVPAEHAKRFRAAAPLVRLINGYGPTENTTFSCAYTVPSPDEIDASLPIGRPIANSTAHVLDADFQLVSPGTAGELFVGGDGLGRGYLNSPKLTNERFVANPFARDGSKLYRTGDRARMRADGLIEFLGRADNQVKIRGYRIEIDEIERALHAHAAVLHAVIVVEDRAGEKALHAVIVRAPRAEITVGELRVDLSSVLPPYMIPHRFTFRDDLPQFTSGKIDRLSLARELACESADASPRPKPLLGRRTQPTRTIGVIAQIWHALLRRTDVDVDENFFDAGGDSLQILALHKQLCERFTVSINVTDLFRDTTIRKQAELIDRVSA